MIEREMDHAVRRGGRAAQDVEVVEASTDHRDAGLGQGVGGGIRTGESDDLVPCSDEVGNDGRSDPAGRAGDENTHVKRPPCAAGRHECINVSY